MPKKILLADDSITIQKVVELTFSDGDYEVTAVNNGAKAIQKLSEMRPDIILSDIIMPEKNGYEVCEFVKSHPEFRTIPVVLLTGTFEPFDPERADKAGCDAVVTKPFESQSLIHKVEELIQQAQSSAPSFVQAPVEAAPPYAPSQGYASEPPVDTPSWQTSAFATPADDSPFSGNASYNATPYEQPAPAADPFAPGFHPQNNDIFASPAASAPAADMPFEEPPSYGGETRAFPRMSFDDLQQMAAQPAAPVPEAASPWDEPAPAPAADYSGETRAFPRMDLDELQRMAPAPSAPAPQHSESVSPWDEPPAAEPEYSGETRAFPRMSFEELQQAAAPAPPPAPEPVVSPWDEPAPAPAADYSGETRAFPRMSFDELQQMANPKPAAAAPEPEAAPWDEPAPAAVENEFEETRAFQRSDFDQIPPPPASEPAPWEEPVSSSSWASTESHAIESAGHDSNHDNGAAAASPFAEPLHHDESPFASLATEPAPIEPEEPAWATSMAMPAPEPEAFPTAVNNQITDAVTGGVPAVAATTSGDQHGDLTDEQVDRIARRVVQLMSEQVVRNIAWEVIPDVAEMVVKDRIRQLENE